MSSKTPAHTRISPAESTRAEAVPCTRLKNFTRKCGRETRCDLIALFDLHAPQKKPRISAGPLMIDVDCSSRPYLPVPVRPEVCGLPIALSLTLSVPVLVPFAVGVKITLKVQLDLAARLLEQVVAEILKSPVVEPEIPVRATLCLLWRVNVFAELLAPTAIIG